MNNQTTTTPKHRRTRLTALRIAGLFAAGAIVLAACGGGGGKTAAAKGSDMAGMAMPSHASAQSSTPVATTDVRIKNFAFSPSTIKVKSGATVVWTNEDSIEHDVTFDGGAISSTTLQHNDTFSHTFTTPGTYHYICSIHPFMHGTVIVG